MEAERRLVLLRHAKAKYPSGVPDHARPLAGRGRRDAQAAGRWFVAEGPRVDFVLCSDATRARHTWEIVRSELVKAKRDAPVQLAPELYGATPDEVVSIVTKVPSDIHTVVVVGHEPTLSTVALTLAGDGSEPDAVAAVEAKFATSCIAVLRFRCDWADVAPGTGVLESFAQPRG